MLTLILGAAHFADGGEAGTSPKAEPIHIGGDLELFIDDYLVAAADNVELTVHEPKRQEFLTFDAPWEGDNQLYFSVMKEEGVYRFYYYGCNPAPLRICCMESPDGIHWTRPNYGIVEVDGSKENNVILDRVSKDAECHDFNPFLDPNPNAPPEEKYKAVGFGVCYTDPAKMGLYLFTSPDAVHWTRTSENAVYTEGRFDTQNVAFWSEIDRKYVLYNRDCLDNARDQGRIIRKSVSDDLVHWTHIGPIQFPEEEAPNMRVEYYTNQIIPYYRNPKILIGLAARYIDNGLTASTMQLCEPKERLKRMPTGADRHGTALTDTIYIVSRDGLHFRASNDVFIRPGLRTAHNWTYGDNYMAWGMVETDSVDDDSPREISIYGSESMSTGGDSRMRRYSFRIDGFASMHAKSRGGNFTTKPLIFDGKELAINFATSAAGTIRVAICAPDGTPYDGYSADDCDLIYGDSLDRRVSWKGNKDVGSLSGKPVILHFFMSEADIYSLQFVNP